MLCIVGGGKMGFALASGISAGNHGEPLTLVDRNEGRRAFLEEWAANREQVSISEELVPCDAAVISVKPKDVKSAVSGAVGAGAQRILSVAAGVSIAHLHDWAGGAVPVLRAMPNVGALFQQSATALCAGPTTQAPDLDWADAVLAKSGLVVRVQEAQMDAVTGLSGSGPAYLFLIAEAMIDAGVGAGLSQAVARDLTVQTFSGAAQLMSKAGSAPHELRADVTTPAGTTAAGLRVLEQRSVRAAFHDAIFAAAERSHKMGTELGYS